MISSLISGTAFQYKIRGYKVVNNKKVYGSYSKIVSTATKPRTPVLSKIRVKAKRVTLNWTKVRGGSGYVIYQYNEKAKNMKGSK